MTMCCLLSAGDNMHVDALLSQTGFPAKVIDQGFYGSVLATTGLCLLLPNIWMTMLPDLSMVNHQIYGCKILHTLKYKDAIRP